MAEKRMMTRKVTDDDHFINLSSSAQALYLHLSMSADDDGFCNQVSVCMFRAHASTQDLQALLDNRYLLQFDNGVIVIKHWRMANSLRKDRYIPTAFQEELSKLEVKDNGSYTLVAERLPDGCQMVAERLPQNSIDKIRVDKDSIEKSSKGGAGGTRTNTRKNHVEVNLNLLESYKSDDADFKTIYPVLVEWLTYKGENKFSYQPQGFKSLVTQILANVHRFGIDAVSGVIRSSMASGYKGIIFDKLKDNMRNSGGNENVFLKMLQEGGTNDQRGNNQDIGSAESGIPTVLPWA